MSKIKRLLDIAMLLFPISILVCGLSLGIMHKKNNENAIKEWEAFKIENNCNLKEVNNQGQDRWDCNGVIYYRKNLYPFEK